MEHLDQIHAQQILNNSYNQKRINVEKQYMTAFRGPNMIEIEGANGSHERVFKNRSSSSPYLPQTSSRNSISS